MARGPGREQPVSAIVGTGSPVARLCMVLATVEREWRHIVGDALAGRSAPVSYCDGVLHVAVDAQSVLHDMNFKKSAIVREIRTKARLPVESVRVEIGRVRRGSAIPLTPRRAGQRRQRAITIDEARIAALRDEILSRHAEMDPELALRIARARALCEAGGER